MTRFSLFRFFVGVGGLYGALALGGCSSDGATEQEQAPVGTLSMPLLASAGGHSYRLQGALYVYGSSFNYLDLSQDTATVSTNLPTGDYSAQLAYWSLTRDDGNGNFAPVVATVSNEFASFEIYNQATTTLSFEFETDGQVVQVGAGNLNVDFHVTETPSICTPMGAGCQADSWCAPPELTGEAVQCVLSGTAALGEACRSPTDCVANSSCFDFGGGAVCTDLCTSAQFDQPCATGGLCTRQGIDYGVCVPGVAAL